MKKKFLTTILLLTLVLSCIPLISQAAELEAVYLNKVMDLDYKAIITRNNGDKYLIEYGVGVLSLWRYEGKTIHIYSPGFIFAGVGSKIMLLDDDQEARIWNAELIDDSVTPPVKPSPPVKVPPPPKPVYGIKQIMIAVDTAKVKAAPDTNALDIGELKYGMGIKDVGKNAKWHTLQTNNGLGYIPKTLTTQYTTVKPKDIKAQSTQTYLFSAPSTKSKIRGSVAKGSVLTVLGTNGNWYFAIYFDKNYNIIVGFVSKTVAW